MTATQRDPDQVLVLEDRGGELFLLGRVSLVRAAVPRDATVSADESALRVLGVLDPSFPIASLGIRTVAGIPAPVMAAPGILDDGEGLLVVDEDGAGALLSRAMLDHVRVRPTDQKAVRQAIRSG